MKHVKQVICAAVLLLSITSLAQEAHEQEHGSDHRDLSISYETTDPAGNPVTVVIDPPAEKRIDEPWFDSASPLFRGYDEVDEFVKFPAGADRMSRAVTVPVYIVADEEYRKRHPDWVNRCTQIVETADNAYWRDFSINWVVRAHYSWTSNGNSASQILADLASDGAGLPDGLVIGFTADEDFNAGGIAYVYNSNPGTGFSVCLDQGVSSTTFALRHEIGHNYGCSHDFDPVVCLMNYTYAYSIDYFDASHDNLIRNRDHWFQ